MTKVSVSHLDSTAVAFNIIQVAECARRFEDSSSALGNLALDPTDSAWMALALLDSVMIRSPALTEFLMGGADGDAIRRQDYIDKWTPSNGPERKRLQDTNRRQTSELIAHLLRPGKADPSMSPLQIARDVVFVMDELVSEMETRGLESAEPLRHAVDHARAVLTP